MIRRFFVGALTAVLMTSAAAAAERRCASPVSAHFEADWWSESQMVGLDPNNPPPKTTRVRLEKWEYSDPIGVPHPDVVTLTIATVCPERDLKVKAVWVKGSKLRPLPVRARGEKRYDLKLAPYILIGRPDIVRATVTTAGGRRAVVELTVELGD